MADVFVSLELDQSKGQSPPLMLQLNIHGGYIDQIFTVPVRLKDVVIDTEAMHDFPRIALDQLLPGDIGKGKITLTFDIDGDVRMRVPG